MGRAYYNEIDPFAAQWLRNLIAAGHIAPGDVDDRSIVDIRPSDLAGYTQCHFFAGIGGWSLAFRLAGWPDDRPTWSGSAPCQPHSAAAANRKRGFSDPRDLWPVQFDLIRAVRPDVFFGEQVDDSAAWIDRAAADLEREGFAFGAVDLPACAADAPHERMRTFIVADAHSAGRREQGGAVAVGPKLVGVECAGSGARISHNVSPGELGRKRRVGPGVRLLADGLPGRVGLLRGFGNAIDPRIASRVIRAYAEHRYLMELLS